MCVVYKCIYCTFNGLPLDCVCVPKWKRPALMDLQI